jgi:2-C-methyl-D-erythritol 4-phosphate cytidylyltransferase
MNIALIVSGGFGKRFNDTIPKQYQLIQKKQVISFVIDAAKVAKSIDKIVVAAHKKYKDLICINYGVDWAEAGAERNQSLRNALEYIKLTYPCKKVIVLDAVRPFITPELIDNYMKILDEYQAVTTAKKITDSLGSYDLHEVDRERYYLLASPEAFNFDLIYSKFDAKSHLTEIIQQFPKETKVFLNFSTFNNIKITYKEDLFFAELLLKKLKYLKRN